MTFLNPERVKKWPSYIVAAVILILPFISSTQALDPALTPRQLLLGSAAIVMIIVYAIIAREELLIHPVFIPVVLLYVVYLVSSAAALNRPEAWYTISKNGLTAAWIFLLYQLFARRDTDVQLIARSVVVFSAVSIVMTLSEMLKLSGNGIVLFSDMNLYELKTPFANKNLLSSILLLCIPLLVYIIAFDRKRWKIIAGVTLVCAGLMIFLVQTKAVIAGLLAGGLIIFMVFVFLAENKKNLVRYSALFLLVCCCIMVFVLKYKEHFIILLNTETLVERQLLWNNTLQMIREHAVGGVGAGNWQIWFPHYGLQKFFTSNYLTSDGFRTFQRPHNDFLWVWSETGVVGLILYVWIFLYALYTGIKNLFMSRYDQHRLLYSMSLVLTLVAYIFTAFFDFPLERPEHQFFLGVLLVLIFSDHATRFVKISGSAKNLSIVFVCFAICCFSVMAASARFKGESHSRKVILAHSRGDWNTMIRESGKAENAYYNMDNFSIPVSWYSGVARFATGDLKGAKADFEKAYRINPYQIHVLNNYATCFEKEGDHKRAVELYDEMLRISPMSPDGILNKSGALFNSGRYTDAYECIKRFKYDESNEKFKTFMLAIVKVHIEDISPGQKKQQKTIDLLSNDQEIIELFKRSQQQKLDLDSMILQKIN